MTDLQSRRAVILGIESADQYQMLRCTVPEAELYGYSTELRSLTQGKATFHASFSAFEPVPENIQEKIVKEKDQPVDA